MPLSSMITGTSNNPDRHRYGSVTDAT